MSAEQAVRVKTDKRTIRADRLDYDGVNRIVTLRADPGNSVEETDADGANAAVRKTVADLGLIAFATSAPTVKTHPLTVPRIGYVHSWSRTQD